jgi:hypothetical protein
MAAHSHTMSEYAATNTVPKSTTPMSHNITNTTGTGSSRNLPYASAMGPADLRAHPMLRSRGAGTKGLAAPATGRVLSASLQNTPSTRLGD